MKGICALARPKHALHTLHVFLRRHAFLGLVTALAVVVVIIKVKQVLTAGLHCRCFLFLGLQSCLRSGFCFFFAQLFRAALCTQNTQMGKV